MMNFMKALPDSLAESASLDGAGHFTILTRIVLPLCKASLATILLFTTVDHWNAWFDGLLYINNPLKMPLQTYLRAVTVQADQSMTEDVVSLARLVTQTGNDTAKIVVAMIPILMVYPFLQKHFVTGITMGSVKG
jgi:putative aldouronate transport system permease protein